VRQTPEDFAEPPPPIEPPGRRVEGGTTFAEGYVTVHLPAERQFIIQTGWDGDVDKVYIAIYDVQAQSPMIIRGDGCETWRLVRDPTADLVFDEIMATLEVGTTYVCPTPSRTTVAREEAPVAVSGKQVTGGEAYELPGFGLTLHLPAGREFQVWAVLADPGGESIGICDIGARSCLSVRPDGCEVSRLVRDRTADPVFDEIMASVEVGTTYICPPAVRTTPEDLSEPSEPEPPSQIPGEHVQGGTPYQCGQVTLQVPAGREFIIGVGVGGPGPFCHIYDVQTQSSLFIDPPGCESGRFVRDPAADAVFDQIVATLEVER